ncbi:MAG: adenosylcobinamide-GDP ribazoletransferase [Rubrivivax sp.]
MLHELRLAFIALQFLTRVPVPRWVGFEPAWLQACLRHFPLVGAGVGLVAAVVLWGALWLWPPLVAATLSVAATVWLTGAFHEDGLADTCDGLGGAVGRERALEIMKDSRIGSYGAMALVLALVLKVVVVSALAATASAPASGIGMALAALVWNHSASRAAPVVLVWRLPYAGDAAHAKAKPLAMQTDGRSVAAALAWLLLLAVGLLPAWPVLVVPLAAALLAGAGATALCARWLHRRLGGFTGDTLGATQQIVELAGLLAWAAALGPGAWR